MTVLERQRARVMWQGQKVHDAGSSLDAGRFHELLMLGGDVFNQKTVKSDPRWPQLRGSEVRSTVCNGKRKFDKEEDICRDKKRGGPMTAEEDDDKEYSKMTGQITATTHKSNKSIRRNKGNSGSDISSKVVCSDVLQSDFIHVRARRGQATDSHSLSERARREKISERMKYLEDLVPGCNKITGKAGILDEIINYVQSLQTQIEFLSMKLATSNPVLDLNIHNLIEPMFSPLATLDEMPLEMSHLATYLQMQQVGGPPISDADTFSDTSWFNQLVSNAPTTPDELHNCYCSSHDLHHARAAASLMSSHQIFNGLEGNRKVEMG